MSGRPAYLIDSSPLVVVVNTRESCEAGEERGGERPAEASTLPKPRGEARLDERVGGEAAGDRERDASDGEGHRVATGECEDRDDRPVPQVDRVGPAAERGDRRESRPPRPLARGEQHQRGAGDGQDRHRRGPRRRFGRRARCRGRRATRPAAWRAIRAPRRQCDPRSEHCDESAGQKLPCPGRQQEEALLKAAAADLPVRDRQREGDGDEGHGACRRPAQTLPCAPSPAHRGRGTIRRMVEGAAARSIFGHSGRSGVETVEVGEAAARSTVLRMVPLPRFAGEDARAETCQRHQGQRVEHVELPLDRERPGVEQPIVLGRGGEIAGLVRVADVGEEQAARRARCAPGPRAAAGS